MAPEFTIPPDATPYRLPAKSRSNGPLTVDASAGGGPNACRTVSTPLLNSNTVPQPALEQFKSPPAEVVPYRIPPGPKVRSLAGTSPFGLGGTPKSNKSVKFPSESILKIHPELCAPPCAAPYRFPEESMIGPPAAPPSP